MKRIFSIIFVVVALTFANTAVNAQTHYNSNVSVGVKGGADLSRMFFNPSVKQGFKPGAMAGVTFRYVEESHFGLIAELNFTQRGWKENFEEAPYEYSRTIDYLMLPVLAHIYFGRRGRFFVNIGPEIGLRLSDSYKANFDPAKAQNLPDFPKYHNTEQYDEPIKQRVDYGISAGLGGEFSLSHRNALYAEVRFYYGLGNLFSSNRRDYFNASNSMNLEFTLGYWLRIK
ncbi:MAG: PorT family protein [Bacteroides sp.]|nr:PorT family protein [Bacteroidales bacterium]MBD5295740.1 PorT family protein [Bacteroides sp.]